MRRVIKSISVSIIFPILVLLHFVIVYAFLYLFKLTISDYVGWVFLGGSLLLLITSLISFYRVYSFEEYPVSKIEKKDIQGVVEFEKIIPFLLTELYILVVIIATFIALKFPKEPLKHNQILGIVTIYLVPILVFIPFFVASAKWSLEDVRNKGYFDKYFSQKYSFTVLPIVVLIIFILSLFLILYFSKALSTISFVYLYLLAGLTLGVFFTISFYLIDVSLSYRNIINGLIDYLSSGKKQQYEFIAPVRRYDEVGKIEKLINSSLEETKKLIEEFSIFPTKVSEYYKSALHSKTLKLKASRERIAVVAVSIVNILELENKHTSEYLMELIETFVGEVMKKVMEGNGFVIRSDIDKIVALYGYQNPTEGAILSAVKQAVDISSLGKGVFKGKDLIIGVGVDYGMIDIVPVKLKNEDIGEINAVGKPIILAKSLSKLSYKLGQKVLITDNVYEYIKDFVKPSWGPKVFKDEYDQKVVLYGLDEKSIEPS